MEKNSNPTLGIFSFTVEMMVNFKCWRIYSRPMSLYGRSEHVYL